MCSKSDEDFHRNVDNAFDCEHILGLVIIGFAIFSKLLSDTHILMKSKHVVDTCKLYSRLFLSDYDICPKMYLDA